MLYNILPRGVIEAFNIKCNVDKIYEIRLRANCPIMVNYDGRYFYLNRNGLSRVPDLSIKVDSETINEVVYRAADYSLYAVTKQINNGYITIRGGIRIGIAGEVVWDGEEIRAVKNFQSLNIRIPHEIMGCADQILEYIVDDNGRIFNSLIISPPGAGKTTILRDIARQLSNHYPLLNVLIIDERSELAAVYDSVAQLDVGINTDVISNCNKGHAFEYAVRAMRPDVIITDEIATLQDFYAIQYALSCGVCVIASIHAKSHLELINKYNFDKIIDSHIMDRFVVLSNDRGPGSLNGIFDDNMQKLD